MKKIFTLAAAVMASLAMSAEVIFSYTVVNPAAGTYEAVGGTAKCTTAMASSGSNEITIGTQTFYKFNSSSAWEFTLADEGTFAVGDVISITAACNASSAKSGKGVKLNDIVVTGDFPANTANTITYTVQEGDAIAGQTTITVKRNDSDIKFGSIAVDREGATPSEDPVESAEISGENACALGGSIEMTCNAPKAKTYQWSMNGAEIEGATAKKYTFTPSAAGEYSFTCAASNEYNVSPVVAAAHVITVSDPADACGELIKAVLNGGTSATMSGVLGGTFDTNLGSGKYKLDKGKYIGIQLAAGSFMAGDVVTITMSAAGQNYPCLFADKERTNCLFLATETSDATEYQITLPAAATGLTTLYLSRDADDATYKWNPTVSSIFVTRSCEASSNADIESLTINGEVAEAVEGVYSYTVGASVELAAVTVNYTLAHPKASATPASGFTVNVPNAGDPANTQVITVTAEDGTQATYTVSVAKSAEASEDATLSALSVEGYTLDPAFDANIEAYTITKAYGAADPELSAVSATPNDANAHAYITQIENGFSIDVTAEDGSTHKYYTITIVEAAAKKDLLEVRFSNNVHGFIANGNINVPYLAGEAEPVFESAKFWNADGEPTAAVVEGNLVVTGIDGQTDTYTITYISVTPMEPIYDEITFDGNEIGQYIYSVYGWDAEKGIKFSKDVEEASNHRISEGKDRICMALPRALSISLTSGSGASRPVKVWVNGSIVSSITKTAAKNESIQIPLDGSKANFLVIESDKNSGDAGFTKMQLEASWATGIDNADAAVKAVKVIRDGKLFIEKNGVLYDAQGTIVK
jgi:hypothetical protein